MAEISTLNGYKIKDKKAVRYYNTVADMVADTTLKNGMHAKTKGYYTVNDGGASEYHITNTQSLSDYQEELNNNLYATLIIENLLNAKQMGAYGDGVHDDTQILQSAINTNKRLILNGTFKITNCLTVDVGYHKGIEGDGIAKIKSDFTDRQFDSFKLVNSLYGEPLTGNYGTARNFIIKNLIITEINEQNITSTTHYGSGICLGNGCNNLKFDNITISNFMYGIVAPSTSHGIYLNKFSNIKTNNNDYGLYFNTSPSNDSGENNSFDQCSFATSKLGNHFGADTYFNFVNCSFDYSLGNTFIIKDNTFINMSGCHIEWYHSTPLINIEYDGSIRFFGCSFVKSSYDDGGSPDKMIQVTQGNGLPEIIFDSCSFLMGRTYTALNNGIPYIKFINCCRRESDPSNYISTAYDIINCTEANKYLYPLNFDSGLTRNQTRIKVTCTTENNGNRLFIPLNYNNKDIKITLTLNSSINLSTDVYVGSGKFLGENIIESIGAVSKTVSLTASTDTTVTIIHKFRKGLTYQPFLRFDLNNLTQGATFEVKNISMQII